MLPRCHLDTGRRTTGGQEDNNKRRRRGQEKEKTKDNGRTQSGDWQAAAAKLVSKRGQEEVKNTAKGGQQADKKRTKRIEQKDRD